MGGVGDRQGKEGAGNKVEGWETELVEEGEEGGEMKSGEIALMKRTWLNKDGRRALSLSESVSVSLLGAAFFWTAQWAV